MIKNRFERLPIAVAAGLTVVVVAACAIRLRGDESASQSSASFASKGDAPAGRLEQCRTVSYEQKDALLECQKLWGKQRKQFFKTSGSSTRLDNGLLSAPSSSPMPRKDESRLLPGFPFISSQSD
ncbi:putative entry exclusion protein TrbK-alt [Bradyrhizobium canariense]|uniref:Conjugative transfer region protein TrbK n=1 Tax=Bradyrhizobium canariense TaxID=255045 RepID=A0A1X3GQ40_9BRAD|nr:putative entry exclusion protein TrbK-alt [Bradyrhizobium canariense]OSI73154.1 hypothetical protein BSZ22_07875 [Bradyrhizobium canariense]OSI81256.1 hypothetical protein BSZ23_07180 [Bradyrhizobium canariense]OSI94531.1 hypothetical protein BSZ25_06480 [Bradyrhizobium canariense]OSI95119.1 hypothetical protein BSZ24_08255 [Bradyrhizobium canariense]OSJ08164.1 hypothetical protein BSZ16_07700 [Bradyrhizobium canariense]